MRKIKSNFFISLDGVVEAPDRWHFPYFDEEMGAAVGAGFATTDAMLMGRVLYEEWAAYWPEHAHEPFGEVMNSMKKYVVSDSLRAAEWQNSELITGAAAQQLRDLDEPTLPLELLSAQTFKSGVLHLRYAAAGD